MTIELTLEVPDNRRITLEVPPEIPVGKVQILLTPVKELPKIGVSLLSLRGSCKGIDTMEAYFTRKRADKALEDRKDS